MMDCRVKPGNDNRFNMAGNRSKSRGLWLARLRDDLLVMGRGEPR
jgi:hypothetical protein